MVRPRGCAIKTDAFSNGEADAVSMVANVVIMIRQRKRNRQA